MPSELTDADVFGRNTPELTDDEVFGKRAGLPSPTPASDRAFSDTNAAPVRPASAPEPDSGMEVARRYGQQQGLVIPEQQPGWAKNATEALAETIGDNVPRSVGDVFKFLTPVASLPDEWKAFHGAINDWLAGKPMDENVRTNFPQSQILVEADKTPAWSKERFKAGFGVLAQMGMAAGLVRGIRGGEISSAKTENQIKTPSSVSAVERQPVVGAAEGQVDEGTASEKGQGTEGIVSETAKVGGDISADKRQKTSSEGQRGQGQEETQVGSGAEAPPSPTSIKNERVDYERQVRGLPPAMEPARQTFGAVWDEAIKSIDENPTIREDLISELKAKPRALNPVENAFLLHKQVELQNDFAKVSSDQIAANTNGDPTRIAENNVRLAKLSDELLDVYNVGKSAGTETGRGLATRRMLANEDFSLAGMTIRKRAVNAGRPLTAEEQADVTYYNREILDADRKLQEHLRAQAQESSKIKSAKTRIQTATTDLERRIAYRDFEKAQSKQPAKLDAEGLKLQSNLDRLKQAYQEELTRDLMAQRTPFQKFQDTAVKWSRMVKLSSVNVFPKLVEAGMIRVISEPVSRVLGQPLRVIAPKTARAAYPELGMNVKSEAENLAGIFTSGKAVWQKLTTQKSNIDVLRGSRGIDREMMNYVGAAHGAIKEPVRQGAFKQSLELRFGQAIKQGLDVHEPAVQTSIVSSAVADADRRIFQSDNPFSRYLIRTPIAALKRADVVGLRTLGNTLDFLMPIVRVSSNIVIHSARLHPVVGFTEAFTRLAIATKRGGVIPPEDAAMIARSFKAGMLGSVLSAYAWKHPQYFGGVYSEQEGKKKPGELKYGAIKFFGITIPSAFNHAPEINFLNTVASARRIYDRYYAKHPSQPINAGTEALAFSLMAPVKNFPFIDTYLRIFSDRQSAGQTAGTILRDATIPSAMTTTLGYLDPTQRRPQNFVQELEMGIPGLRSNVPVKQTKSTLFRFVH